MNYVEFRDTIGEMDVPTLDAPLLTAKDSIHLQIILGLVVGGEYRMLEPAAGHFLILDTIKTVEDRGGKRGIDYIVTCHQIGSNVVCTLHSTNSFLSDEDFSPSIRRLHNERD